MSKVVTCLNDCVCREDGNCSNEKEGEPRRHGGKRCRAGVFMAGVDGVRPFVEQPKAYNIQRKVQAMCGWKSTKGFPGCQPVSMDLKNMELLREKPYRVSWKADGTRYMMLIDGDKEVYFLDRDNNVFLVEGVSFPHRKGGGRYLRDTLLDGEMVIDVVGGERIPRYLVYDIIKFEGQEVGKAPFHPVRLQCIQDEVVGPRNAAIAEGRINKAAEPFGVRRKDFWDVTTAAGLLGDKFARQLSHEPDGLVFQPSRDPYIAGRCDHVLKWKPLNMNSVDFRLKLVREGGEGVVPRRIGYLYVGQLDRPFGKIKYSGAIKELNNKIVECKYENSQWVFMRERTDKSFPNSYTTATGMSC